MQINVTKSNLNALAARVAETSTHLGFTKHGSPMVTSQGLRVIATLAGFREEHSFVAALKAEPVSTSSPELDLLQALTANLLGSYNDDQWDASTRELLERANAMVGGDPIVWVLEQEEPEGRPTVQEQQLLSAAGYAVSEDPDQPGMWLWRSSIDACEVSFYSKAAAELDALAAMRNAHSYTQRSFELGAMSREALLDALADAMEANDSAFDPAFENLSGDELRALILEQEFPGSSDPADMDDDADALGVDLDDVRFWVGLHYKVNFDAESADRKLDWLHRYREVNGLTP